RQILTNLGSTEALASKEAGLKNRLTVCTSGSWSMGKTSCNDYATLSQTCIVLTQSKGIVGG
ncbi:hypothetical protein BS47DRAFT_1347950, partial [Hydnum rufescens UP504]